MRLILTRHGETEENQKGILQGWRPGHLTAKGKKQAKLLAKRLQQIHIDVIYTSDLRRCVETAQEIARHHKDVRFLKEKILRERKLGEFEGKALGQADWEALPGDVYTNKPKGGESFVEVRKRLERFYKKLLQQYKDETIVVVTHGGSLLLLQGLIYNKDLKSSLKLPQQKHTAISEFEINRKGRHKVLCLNCEKHL